MAKKIKFPLEFSNGVKVRTLEELQQYADVESILRYYHNGKLKLWLMARDYNEIVQQLNIMDTFNPSDFSSLCKLLGIKDFKSNSDIEKIWIREERINYLKKLTSDETIISNVEYIVFSQKELDELVKRKPDIVYLSANENQVYIIDKSIKHTKYIGVFGSPKIQIDINKVELLKDFGISFKNVILPKCLYSYWRSVLEYNKSNCDFDLDCKVNISNAKKLHDIIHQEFSSYQCNHAKMLNLESFRARVCALQYWWDNYSNNNSYSSNSLFEVNIFTPDMFLKSKNIYVKIILSELAPDKGQNRIYIEESGSVSFSNPINLNEQYRYRSLKDIFVHRWFNCLKKSINELPIINSSCGLYIGINLKNLGTREYRLIFWWLVFVALDTELYNNHLSYICDVADLFGFNVYMMKDWCKAVRYWLDGITINEKNFINGLIVK